MQLSIWKLQSQFRRSWIIASIMSHPLSPNCIQDKMDLKLGFPMASAKIAAMRWEKRFPHVWDTILSGKHLLFGATSSAYEHPLLEVSGIITCQTTSAVFVASNWKCGMTSGRRLIKSTNCRRLIDLCAKSSTRVSGLGRSQSKKDSTSMTPSMSYASNSTSEERRNQAGDLDRLYFFGMKGKLKQTRPWHIEKIQFVSAPTSKSPKHLSTCRKLSLFIWLRPACRKACPIDSIAQGLDQEQCLLLFTNLKNECD